ncbi:PepSY-associated TM helix domain-containing protein [Sphingopyxis sp. H115]|uniref:PepSY-associated TM helix domain-containing protein n=1 Tax=Sphingopyxis sp. H115 TaxID=1759073 RepID=UPI0009E888F3|nr:PepSY-associated TM helix domain-containing protein [Sphingopyxis sp. H115]
MKTGFRQSIAGLHSWSGLILGWLLFAIALSGTATVFRSEISGWMRPEVVATTPPDAAIKAAVRWLEAHHPKAAGWYLTAPDERIPTTQAVFDDAAAPAGYRDIALDPVSGSPDVARATLGGEFLYRFHFELQLPYPWGRYLAVAAAMLMLIAIVSGIIVHKRIFKDIFTFRAGKGKRSWLDAHNVLGVLALPFHLMITVTGIVTLLSLVMPWGTAANYGEDLKTAFAEAAPGLVSRDPAGRPAPLAPIGPMLAAAQHRFGEGRVGRVSIANPGDVNAIVTISRHDGDQLAYAAQTVSFDGPSGQILKTYAETRPAQRTYDVLYGLHMGRFAPQVSRWLYFLCGLALAATIATGLILWIRSRPQARGAGPWIAARLNVGAVAGFPAAILGFFYANRLFPVDIPERAEAEVSAFFWVWGAAILFAMLREPARAWREAFAVLAAAAALLPVVSFVATGRGLWSAVIGGDWLFAGFDLTLFAFAVLAAAIARRAGVASADSARRRGPRAVPA